MNHVKEETAVTKSKGIVVKEQVMKVEETGCTVPVLSYHEEEDKILSLRELMIKQIKMNRELIEKQKEVLRLLQSIQTQELHSAVWQNVAAKLTKRSDPDKEITVYVIVMKREGALNQSIGTCFAVSDDLAVSAWHNFTDNDFQPTDEIHLCTDIAAGEVDGLKLPAKVLEYDAEEGWVTLMLVNSTFPHHAALCSEHDCRDIREDKRAHSFLDLLYFPSGPIDTTSNLTLQCMSGKLNNGVIPFRTSARNSKRRRDGDEKAPNVRGTLNIQSTNTLSSGGAPYIMGNGKVLGFHVCSMKIEESSTAHPHTAEDGYNVNCEGRILARLKSFSAKYPHLL